MVETTERVGGGRRRKERREQSASRVGSINETSEGQDADGVQSKRYQDEKHV